MTRVPPERGHSNSPVLDVPAFFLRKKENVTTWVFNVKALFACGQGLIGKALEMRGHTKNVL